MILYDFIWTTWNLYLLTDDFDSIHRGFTFNVVETVSRVLISGISHYRLFRCDTFGNCDYICHHNIYMWAPRCDYVLLITHEMTYIDSAI